MIETTQGTGIAAPISAVWDHVSDISRWAPLMPGMQSVEMIDADRSRWVLKVGVGGLVRTVKVEVTVDRWAGPDEVDFTYVLTSDPVKGSGTYRANTQGAGETAIELHVKVEGSGPMAPMWEAMGKPVLPQLAKAFAGALKGQIEAAGTVGLRHDIKPHSILDRLLFWLRRRLGLS
ncbi:SRPBCC family protein [Novosphingobium sp. MW5]|nr:SRPBCC family protein [Novosphingobium sp. MW5]